MDAGSIVGVTGGTIGTGTFLVLIYYGFKLRGDLMAMVRKEVKEKVEGQAAICKAVMSAMAKDLEELKKDFKTYMSNKDRDQKEFIEKLVDRINGGTKKNVT